MSLGGPTDAIDRDKKFVEKWVEPDEIKKCLRSDNWIITGEKGAGKTAIRKALVEIYGNQYFASAVVDFNNISFHLLHEHLVSLAMTTKLSKTATLSHFWQYAMLVELIAASAAKNPAQYQEFLRQIPSDRGARVSLNQRLMQLLEEAWNWIDEFTGARTTSGHNGVGAKANMLASGGLSAKLLEQLSRFPLGPEFEALKQRFFRRVEQRNDRIVLILDGFDRLKTDGSSAHSTRLIFASLVDAIQSIHADPDLPPTLEIKAFVPHDRYLSLPLRDSDKIDTMHVAIRWTRSTLQDFVKRRLELTPKVQESGTFATAWRQVMPEHVHNQGYRIDEDSFDYIVRHTMMRPRQPQIHLEQLALDHFDRNIDPSMVPNSVAESSKKIAKYFIDEFKTDHAYMSRFVSSLHRKDNILEYKEFLSMIDDALKKHQAGGDDVLVEDMVDSLYSMGFFGVLNFIEPGRDAPGIYCPPTKESKRHFVDFFFKNPHPSISGTLQDSSLVALHPVFVDFCSLRAHPSLIVG